MSAESDSSFQARKLSFSLTFHNLESPYDTMSVFLLPKEVLQIGVNRLAQGESLVLTDTDGTRVSGTLWQVTAPERPGLYGLTVYRAQTDETARINVFVLHPLSEVRDGKLNGYLIGAYPGVALSNLAIYKPPRGLLEVTRENTDTWITPHYKLGQFVCKQAGNYPRYLILRTALLLKLEFLTEQAVAAGYASRPFHIMSGYRTPYYNRAIGNGTYSRHIWGGAVDIFIDENPADGLMDDLNGDGKVDVGDARVLYDFVESFYSKPEYKDFIGGLGVYTETSN
ncbi:MAG: hypothetical protein HUJ31_01255, partial [Pseudomonadales bacterium]|nr:hypothetical protein [Pseudomonadales bacterium]